MSYEKQAGLSASASPIQQGDLGTEKRLLEPPNIPAVALDDNESLLKLAMDASGMGAWELDLRTQRLKWSYGHFVLFGIAPENFDGKVETALQPVHEEDRDRVWAEIMRARDEHSNCDQEFRVVWPDGSVRWIASRARIHYAETGEAVRVTGVNWDFTEQKLAADQLAQTEEKFRKSLETVEQPFGTFRAVRDASGRITDFHVDYANAAALADMDLKPEQYIGKNICQLFPAHREGPLFQAYVDIVETGAPLRLEGVRYCDLMGGREVERWYDIHATKLHDGFVAAWRNVTEQQKVRRVAEERQARLSESEELYRATFDTAAVGIAHVSLEGQWLRFNDAVCSITGYTREELLARTFTDITHPEDIEADWNHVRALMAGKCASYDMDKRYLRKDGSTVWVHLTVSVVRDRQGKPLHMVSVIENISDKKKAEEELRRREQDFRQLANSIPQPAWTCDQSGACDFMSDRWMEFTGTPTEQNLGYGWLECLHPEDREPTARIWAESVARRAVLDTSFRIRRFNGEYRWFLTLAVPYQGDDGAIKWFGTNTDITVQREAVAALTSSEKRFRELADSLPQLIWVSNAAGENTYCNQRFSDYTGLPVNEMMRMDWQAIVHPDDLERTIATWTKCVLSREPYLSEYRLRRHDGEYRYFLARAIPVFNEAGELEQWMGSSTDIHDQKLAEEALRRSEKLAVTGRLASSIAHEINNPLMAVTELLYLIAQEQSLSPQGRQLLRTAEEELARVAQIVTQTLRFHKSSKLPSAVDVREISDSVLALFKGRFAGAQISLEKRYREVKPIVCYGDEIRQVIANLVGNAHDAMASGGRLTVAIRAGGSWTTPGVRGVRISIADNGHGISAAIRRHLFEPFVTTKESTGTGLGLWVTAEIVRRHGGTISFRTSVAPQNSGTIFSLFLPSNGVGEESQAARSVAVGE